MSHDLAALMDSTGAATVAELASRASEHSVRTWLRLGRVVQLHPGVLALAERRDDWLVRAHAAVLYTRGQLSHTTALSLWRVIEERPASLHVSIPANQGIRSTAALVVHRSKTLMRPYDISGLPVNGLDSALIESWALLNRHTAEPGSVQLARAAVITAVRSGRISAGRLRGMVATRANLGGRSTFLDLLDLIAAGCHSELESGGFVEF